MAHLKGPVPLPTTARVCSQTGALPGCAQLPSSSRDDHWDEGPNISGCHQPRCTLAACQAVGLAEDLGGALWAEESTLSQVHCYLCLGTTERGNGFWYLLPLPSAHPEGASWQPLTPAPGRQREGTPLPADLGGDTLLLASSQNFTV